MFLLTLAQLDFVATRSFFLPKIACKLSSTFGEKRRFAKNEVVQHLFSHFLYNPLPPLQGESLSFASSVQKGVIRACSLRYALNRAQALPFGRNARIAPESRLERTNNET